MSTKSPSEINRRPSVFLVGAIAGAVVAVAFLAVFIIQGLLYEPPPTAEQQETIEKIELLGALKADWFHAGGTLSESEALRAASNDSTVHLLFLGVDRRKNERGRADAIHLLRFQPGRITLFSMPRDCLVTLRGDSRPEKLNHAYAYGGHALLQRTMEDLLKIHVDGYLEVDLQTFVRVAQIAKTVTLDGKLIGAEDVFVHINGWLSWLRNRSLPGGDFRRVARQQMFIAKALDWIMALYQQHPRVLLSAVQGVLRFLPTDITPNQAMLLCQIYADVPSVAPADTRTAAPVPNPFAQHPAVRSMERFIMPGAAVMIDIRTGEEIVTDTNGRAAATVARANAADSGTPAAGTASPTSFAPAEVPQPDLNQPLVVSPVPTADGGDTGFILSFYRINAEQSLAELLRTWRSRRLSKNYEDKDELFR